MRLVTYRQGGHAPRPGVMDGADQVIDLRAAWPAAAGEAPLSIRQLLERGAAGLECASRVAAAGPGAERHSLADVELLPPIPDAEKFLCVGKNYRNHLDELERNGLLTERPQEPTGFVKLNSVLVGQDARVARPDGIVMFDYEPEMVFVIGKPAYRVSKRDALDHVAGVMLLNDLTAREIQKREVVSGTRFWTAKNMPGFGPLGPYLVTLDEAGDPHDLWVTCTVNGEQRIRVHTGDQIFKLADIIEHFSRYMPLQPGDLFATGAPGGVAVGQPNAAELFLKPGDVVEVAIEGLMSLRTYITAPAAS